MAEIKLPRLLGAAKEFNIGQDTLIEFLVGKGFDRDELKPTAKLTLEMYEALQHNFQGDKNAKSKADQIEIPKSVQAERKRKEEEEITFRKEESKQAAPEVSPKPAEAVAEPEVSPELPKPVEPVIDEEKVEEPVAEVVASEPEVIKIEAPEIEGPKIIDKIDLSAVGKPKKTEQPQPQPQPPAEEVAQPVEEVPEIAPVEEAPEAAPQEEEPAPAPDEPVVIQNIRAERIEGPKVLGKISLPVENDTRPKPGPAAPQREEKRKRKRIPIDKKGVGNTPPPDRRTEGQPQSRPPYGGGGDNRFRRDG
ncbi:MAG: translation initiation factor IF-2, partial [Parafilimonas sp.]